METLGAAAKERGTSPRATSSQRHIGWFCKRALREAKRLVKGMFHNLLVRRNPAAAGFI